MRQDVKCKATPISLSFHAIPILLCPRAQHFFLDSFYSSWTLLQMLLSAPLEQERRMMSGMVTIGENQESLTWLGDSWILCTGTILGPTGPSKDGKVVLQKATATWHQHWITRRHFNLSVSPALSWDWWRLGLGRYTVFDICICHQPSFLFPFLEGGEWLDWQCWWVSNNSMEWEKDDVMIMPGWLAYAQAGRLCR